MQIRRLAARLILPIALVLSLSGCAAANYKVHPGAAGYISGAPTPVQLFTSQSYDSLVATDAVIQQTRADFLANKFPASTMPAIRNAFNTVVVAYDTAQSAWIAFNSAAATNPSTSQATLAAAVAAMQTALSNLTVARQGGS